jgi:hypothetical protein
VEESEENNFKPLHSSAVQVDERFYRNESICQIWIWLVAVEQLLEYNRRPYRGVAAVPPALFAALNLLDRTRRGSAISAHCDCADRSCRARGGLIPSSNRSAKDAARRPSPQRSRSAQERCPTSAGHSIAHSQMPLYQSS